MGAEGVLRLLGPVELEVDGRVVAVRGAIPRLILVQLASAVGQPVTDDDLVLAVWGEQPPDTVAATLRMHASALRSVVTPLGWQVLRRQPTFRLVAPGLTLDTDAVTAAEQFTGPAADELDVVERTLALWRGPSLADVRRLPLGERLAESLDRRRTALGDRRLQLLLDLDRATEVLRPLEELVRTDPLDEARWAMLALAHYRTGHPAQALRVLADARRTLDAEAGLTPGPALLDLQQRILAHDVPPVPSTTTTAGTPILPTSLGAQLPPRLHGRDAELAALTRALDDVAARGTSAVLRVSGEPGTGKSALLASFADRAVRRGVPVLFGWAEQDAAHPLDLLAGPLAALVDASPGLRDSDTRAVLAGILGWTGGPYPSGRSEATSPDAQGRSRALDAVRRTLMADPSALVVVLDDAHWADEVSLAAVHSIARHPVARPLLVVAADRGGRAPALAGRGITELELRPLDAEGLAAWTERSDAGWLTELGSLTGGLPLLVQDVLHEVAAGVPLAELRTGVGRRLLRDRAGRLDPRVGDVLLVAALLGRSFRYVDVQAITGAPDVELVVDLDAAVAAGVLELDVSDAGVFRFEHDLVRLAVLEGAIPLRRSRLHATVLESITGLDSLLAVHHARAAGPFVQVSDLAELVRRAALEELQAFGFDRARQLVQDTLDEHSARISPGVLARLLAILARAETALGSPLESRAHLDEALGAAESAGDVEAAVSTVELLDALFGHGEAMSEGTPERLAVLLRRLPDDATDSRFAVLRQLIFAHISAGRLTDAADLLADARPLAARLGTPEAEMALLHLEHFRSECAGETGARRRLVERAAGVVRRHSHPVLRARYLGMAIVQHLHEGEVDRVGPRADELVELGGSTGDPYHRWLGLSARVVGPLLRGDLETAALLAEDAYRHANESDLFAGDSAWAGQLAVLGWVSGRLPDFQRPQEAPDLDGPEFAWNAVRALFLTLAGEVAAARAILPRLIAAVPTVGAQWIGFVGVALSVETAFLLDDQDLLHAAEPVLTPRRHDHVILGTGVLDLGPVTRYLALVLAGTGRPTEAVPLLEQVHDDLRSGALWQLRAHHDLRRLGRDVPRSAGATSAAGSGAWAWLDRP